MLQNTYLPQDGRTRRLRIEAARNTRRGPRRAARSRTCADPRPRLGSPRSAERSLCPYTRTQTIAAAEALDSIRGAHPRQPIAYRRHEYVNGRKIEMRWNHQGLRHIAHERRSGE